MKHIIVMSIFVISQLGAAGEKCDFMSLPIGDYRVNRFGPQNKGDVCLMSVNHKMKSTQPLSFTSEGQVSISLSLSDTGRASKAVGARTYYIIPADDSVILRNKESKTEPPVVEFGSGIKFHFEPSADKVKIKDIIGCKKRDANDGWLSKQELNIHSCKGKILIDAGVGRGGLAVDNPNGKSRLISDNGASCDVSNQLLFVDKAVIKGDHKVFLRAKTHEQIAELIAKIPQCKSLNFSKSKRSTEDSSTIESTR